MLRLQSALLKAKTEEEVRSLVVRFLATADPSKVVPNPVLASIYTDEEGGKRAGWEVVLDLIRDNWSFARHMVLLGLITVP